MKSSLQETCNNFNKYENQQIFNNKKSFSRAKKNSVENFNPDFKEKLLSFSCYFTFGLSGLILIIVNFFTGQQLSKFTSLHTFHSLLLGILVLLSIVILDSLTFLSNVIIDVLSTYKIIYNLICINYLPIVFCIMSFFAITALLGKILLLPGLKNVVKQTLK